LLFIVRNKRFRYEIAKDIRTISSTGSHHKEDSKQKSVSWPVILVFSLFVEGFQTVLFRNQTSCQNWPGWRLRLMQTFSRFIRSPA